MNGALVFIIIEEVKCKDIEKLVRSFGGRLSRKFKPSDNVCEVYIFDNLVSNLEDIRKYKGVMDVHSDIINETILGSYSRGIKTAARHYNTLLSERRHCKEDNKKPNYTFLLPLHYPSYDNHEFPKIPAYYPS